MTYQIRNWDQDFENHESRKVKSVRWVGLPNKHDGKGYRRVAAHRDAVPVFCAWNLIVQVASKMPKRGLLADEDGPLDASDLSAMTGFPSEIFEKAFKLLTDRKIGWLEVIDAPEISRDFPQSPVIPPEIALEGKGMEGNGREDKSIVAAPAPTRCVQVFEYWKQEHGKNGSTIFGDKRKRAVERALKDGNTVEYIKRAIRGIKLDPHCSGQNETKTVYNELELICRDQIHLDRYAALDAPRRAPPVDDDCRDCRNTGLLTVADPANGYENKQIRCRCEYGTRRPTDLQTNRARDDDHRAA